MGRTPLRFKFLIKWINKSNSIRRGYKLANIIKIVFILNPSRTALYKTRTQVLLTIIIIITIIMINFIGRLTTLSLGPGQKGTLPPNPNNPLTARAPSGVIQALPISPFPVFRKGSLEASRFQTSTLLPKNNSFREIC